MRGTKPPEGYQLFIAPRYILKKGDVAKVYLPKNMGELLSIFVGSRGRHMLIGEIADILYSNRLSDGPDYRWEVTRVVICQLKNTLRGHGIVLNIEAQKGRMGYRFTGFGECEALPESERKSHRRGRKPKLNKRTKTEKKVVLPKPPKEKKVRFVPNPQDKTIRKLRKTGHKKPIPKLPRYRNSGRPHFPPPKVLPPEYEAAQEAPWYFPNRHEEAK